MNEQELKNFKKKQTIKLTVLVLSFILIITSVTYAFFAAGIGGAASTDIDATSEVSENSSFIPGEPINIHATLANFGENMGSLSGETTSSAKLIASSSVGSASLDYQVYFKIDTNDFEYTVDSNTPEMIITVTDPEGNELTAIDGLTPVTVTDALTSETISGFDVTTFTGLIKIAEDYNISTTSSTDGTQQDWTVKLTFVNLDTLQTANEGKTFSGQLLLQTDKVFILNTQILIDNDGASAIEAKGEPNFINAATTNVGMYAAEDTYGTSYYYRGTVDNNWVYFAGFYWRIVRVNGDGSVRLIYTGTVAPIESEKVMMLGSKTAINELFFNESQDLAEYVGYMYKIGDPHGLDVSSTVKQHLEMWYQNNLTSYDNYISDNLFCYDRELASSGYQNSDFTIKHASLSRLTASTTSFRSGGTGPVLTCSNKSDAFTVFNIDYGNGKLTYKIGLLTADEGVMAGMEPGETVDNNYLYTNRAYWLGTPFGFYTDSWDRAYMWEINSAGNIYNEFVTQHTTDVRPVISIKTNTLANGAGTWDNPYVIKN